MPQQQQQPFGMGNNANNSNGSGMMGFPNTNASPENLYDSIRIAVNLGYISADLFNSQLPSEVLTLLNQLFDKLNQLINVNNRITALKRKTTVPTPQFKAEIDLLNQEAQNLKDNLTLLKNKINLAHMQLKQQQQNMNPNKIGKPNMMNNNVTNVPLVTTPPAVNNGPLSSSSNGSNNLGLSMNLDVMSSLLGSQLNDLSLKDAQNRPKQFANDSNPMNQMNRQSQNPFSSYSSPSPVINNWSGLSLGDNLGLDQPAIDDGVIPFVPGKIWAGTGPSVEDDPNCTPGSVSRPLLTGAIDPESILGSLQRNGQWNSNKPFDLSNSLNSSMGSHLGNQIGSATNNSTNRQGRNNSGAWPSNSNNYMSQMSMPASSNNNANNSGSIGEQLWGVRGGNNGNNRIGNTNSVNNQQNSNSLLNNRNSSMINTNNGNNSLLNQQQQQQFFRSNSWNMNSQQPQMNLDNRNSSMSNNNNFNLNNGHFILIRNVTLQVSNFE